MGAASWPAQGLTELCVCVCVLASLSDRGQISGVLAIFTIFIGSAASVLMKREAARERRRLESHLAQRHGVAGSEGKSVFTGDEHLAVR